MATLDQLKQALRQIAEDKGISMQQPLSDIEYSTGFEILLQGPGWLTYQDFIIPQLSQLLSFISKSQDHISVLEIGAGPKSVIAHLPESLRRRITNYNAFEPNQLFATRLGEWLDPAPNEKRPLSCLENQVDIRRSPFVLQDSNELGSGKTSRSDDKYDVILFCHSMYCMKPKRKFVERALELLVDQPGSGMVVVFHRDGALRLDGLVSHATTSFPTATTHVLDDDEELDHFASFVAGFSVQEIDANDIVRSEWRKICRALGARDELQPNHIVFSSPDVMEIFTCHATSLPELTEQVPFFEVNRAIKNRKARLHRPASIIRPTEIRHIQECVQWAIKNEASLTVIGGGHSDHCLWPDAVAIDMGAFDQVHILETAGDARNHHLDSYPEAISELLVVAGAGSTVGSIIRKTMEADLTIPLGSRPSVGSGLWLQGGIGHLSRLHGLSCDAIVGAIVVSAKSGQLLRLGYVPSEHCPVDTVCPDDEADLLWAIKGAGTNFAIVVSVVFKAVPASNYFVRNWSIPLADDHDAHKRLNEFEEHLAIKLQRNCSADAYLYWEVNQLQLGVTVFESSTTHQENATPVPIAIETTWGLDSIPKKMDAIGLFEAEMYISGMHGGHNSDNGGHGNGKTSSFKRCVFLKNIGDNNVSDHLVAAFKRCPSPLCYLHLLHGGGAVNDIEPDVTAFSCRDWHFACVITGVWPREKDDSEIARSAEQWVYDVVDALLPFSSGVYGADLGPDPRDKALVAKAFGPNLPRLMRLKHRFDPINVLAYTCPIQKATAPKIVILVTGRSGAGKDYCANFWVSLIHQPSKPKLSARVVSISDETKHEYAAATGADFTRLLEDRAYKEQHRPALTRFFHEQVQQHPRLPQENFMRVVYGAADVDVLLITGLREDAPIANLSNLVPECKLLEVCIQVDDITRNSRLGSSNNEVAMIGMNKQIMSYLPSFVFENNAGGSEMAKVFAEERLLPLFHQDFERLAAMVRTIPGFPCPGIEFRHVLGIPQQPDGLNLCTSLLQSNFDGEWASIDAIVTCEVGGIIYATALASRLNVPLVLIRKAGKLPPPVVSACKPPSYISSLQSRTSESERIEMEQNVIPKGGKVVVVDDVMSTGRTLCAVIKLLTDAGINLEDISVIVVAEFPIHCGRKLLYQYNYGQVKVQSLLVFGST